LARTFNGGLRLLTQANRRAMAGDLHDVGSARR
jgi:hypothetical protein